MTGKGETWSRDTNMHLPFDVNVMLKGSEKSATKNMQLGLQHCCKTSWMAVLPFYHQVQTC